MRGEYLAEENLETIKNLYEYSLDLTNKLIYIQNAEVSWRELTRNIDIPFARHVDNKPEEQ